MRSVYLLASVGAIIWAGSVAHAQVPGRQFGTVPPPTLSPYLNLARPGPSALNYYGLVRPQQDFLRSIQGLQGQVLLQQQLVEGMQGQGPMVVTTGHPAYFLNYSNFFLTMGNNAPLGGNRPAGARVQGVGTGVGTVSPSRYGSGFVPSYGPSGIGR